MTERRGSSRKLSYIPDSEMEVTRTMADELFHRFSGEEGMTSTQLVELTRQTHILDKKKTTDSDVALICKFRSISIKHCNCARVANILLYSSRCEGWQEANPQFG